MQMKLYVSLQLISLLNKKRKKKIQSATPKIFQLRLFTVFPLIKFGSSDFLRLAVLHFNTFRPLEIFIINLLIY